MFDKCVPKGFRWTLLKWTSKRRKKNSLEVVKSNASCAGLYFQMIPIGKPLLLFFYTSVVSTEGISAAHCVFHCSEGQHSGAAGTVQWAK